jgi:F-type H+-transporting ATPase subunit b
VFRGDIPADLRKAVVRVKWFCILLVIVCLCSFSYGAETQAEGMELSPFEGAFADALWTIIAFVVLLLVLWKWAWKPILGALNARQEHIEKQISSAEETRKEAERVLAEYRGKLENVASEGRAIIAGQVAKAQQESKEIIAVANEKTELIMLKSEADIEKARNEARAELFDQASEMVLQLGGEILGRAINDADNERFIGDAVARLKQEEIKKD